MSWVCAFLLAAAAAAQEPGPTARPDSEPGAAAAALGKLLGDPDAGRRAAAAQALGALLTTAVNRDAEQDVHDLPHRQVVRAACAVVPVAGRGLADGSAPVRLHCGEALGRAAEVLGELVDDPSAAGEVEDWPAYQREVEAERAALRPLIAAMTAQSPAMASAAADPDIRVRLVARHALEDVAGARWRLLRRASSAVAAPQGVTYGSAGDRSAEFLMEDPLLAGLRQALPALAAGAQGDPDVRGRRAAIDVLETLGRPAAPAALALLAALADHDRFVRWAAARALGKIRPANTEVVIPALARLLKDGDLDLGLAAVNALRAYGPAARPALPALSAAARAHEPEMRLAVMRALESVGGDDAAALAVLSAALTDPDGRVRQAAGQVLETIGPSRREAADALLRPSQKEGTGPKVVGSVRPR
jgi:HEAT repeat protein